MGSQRLAQWIRQPLVDVNQIQNRHNIVEAFVQDPELRQSLQDVHLKVILTLHYSLVK